MKYFLIIILICSQVFASYSERELVAAVIIKEAGGEGNTGMQAVACVIENRMKRNRSAFYIVTRPKQFSCLNGVKDYESYIASAKRHKRWPFALQLSEAIETYSVNDITYGSQFYHAAGIMPYWADVFKFQVQIGHHLFYKK